MSIGTIDTDKLLRGEYERERLPKDFSAERIVPDYAFNVLNRAGLLYRPVVDEHYLAGTGKRPSWPGGRRFAVCLTHDVDSVSETDIKHSLRRISAARSAFERVKYAAGLGINIVKSVTGQGRIDPCHQFEKWLDTEESHGARSTFFFWPGFDNVSRHHPSDCPYNLSDPVVFEGQQCTVAEMARVMDRRGFEIGLHPSWYTFNDVDELKRQKEAIEKVLSKEVRCVRQHFLHYDIRITPRVHDEAGFSYDSTLGFNDNVGFRFGTSYPWHLYDLERRQHLGIMEIPYAVQDGAMLLTTKGMRLDEDTAFLYVRQIIDAVEAVGGVLNLVWHPHYITQQHWWNLYVRTLEHLKTRDPWFGTVSGVGDFFGKENRDIVKKYTGGKL